MKITRSDLKRLIKEELENAIEENRTYNQLFGDEYQKFRDRNPFRSPEDAAFDAAGLEDEEKAAYLSARQDDEIGVRAKPKARNPQLAATMQKLVKQRDVLDQQIAQLQGMIDRS